MLARLGNGLSEMTSLKDSLRDQQRKLKAKCQLPPGDPVSLVEFLAGIRDTTTHTYITPCTTSSLGFRLFPHLNRWSDLLHDHLSFLPDHLTVEDQSSEDLMPEILLKSLVLPGQLVNLTS